MIARIRGRVIEKGLNCLLIDIAGIVYEVLLPSAVMQRVDEKINPEGMINLVIYHYHQIEPSRSTPVLIGFVNEVEKEFFEAFITVSGIGPRAALKALNQPISSIARAIDEGDINFLKSLPGIGQQRAREIVAKLQNKVGKFALIQDGGVKTTGGPMVKDIEEEALAVLSQLGYKKPEALNMIRKVFDNGGNVSTTEELLNEVYKQRKLK